MYKLKYILILYIIFTNLNLFAATPKKVETKTDDEITVDENKIKKIIWSSVDRGFQNIGGDEVISLLYNKAIMHQRSINQNNTLEVGCKSGKTTHYINIQGCEKIWGTDINEEYIKQAQEKYDNIKFINSDITKLTKEFDDDFFSFIYSLNIINAMDDHVPMLQRFKAISKDNSLIALSGYYLKNENDKEIYNNLSNKVTHPVILSHMKQMMQILGFELLEEVDITDKYSYWHKRMIANIQEDSETFIIQEYTEDEIRTAIKRLSQMIGYLDENRLGAIILIAKKI